MAPSMTGVAGASTTFQVNTTGDSGDGTCDATCTLRDAILNANAAAGADTVTFASSVTGTITLGGTAIPVTDAVDIEGPGASVLAVSGATTSRIFDATGVDGSEMAVTVHGLTLRDGHDGDGGAIRARDAVLTISDSILTGNVSTGTGGAVYVDSGGFVMLRSEVSNNQAPLYGGGIATSGNDAGGDMIIRDSTITGNSGRDGGGVSFYDINSTTTATFNILIQRTTISGNTSSDNGGGIYIEDSYYGGGVVTIEDSTISGNTAGGDGGGISKVEDATEPALVVRNTTVSGNSAQNGGGVSITLANVVNSFFENSTIVDNTAAVSGGGIWSTDPVTIKNSIAANNTAPDGDLGGSGAFTIGYSLIEDDGGVAVTAAPAGSNLTGVDPKLGPLQNNGGPTKTHKPLAGSPVIEAGDPAFNPPPAYDQRGYAREVSRLDMGAVEVEALISIGDVALTEGDGGTVNAVFPVTLSAPASTPITVNFTTANGSATSPADYTAVSGTVTFAAGETSKTITVPVVGDDEMEGTETFVVNLSGASGAVISDAQGVATITDDDVFALGYRMVAADGGIFTFGDRLFHGSTGDMKLNKPIVGGATDVSNNDGYWIVASDGGVFTFNAPFFGSLGDQTISSPAVEIEPTPTGKGYWIVLADGKVYPFGDAAHFGDMSGKALNKPIIGMTVTPSGKGYWLVAQDGGIFNFGDAEFFGSMGDKALNAPIIDLAPSVDNQGYYLLGRDGGVFTFGSADFKGSTGDMKLNAPVIAMLLAPNGAGYWLAASDGGVFTFGSVPFLGSMGDTKLNSPVLDLIL